MKDAIDLEEAWGIHNNADQDNCADVVPGPSNQEIRLGVTNPEVTFQGYRYTSVSGP